MEPTAALVVAALVVAAVLCRATVRVTPAGHCGVVTRAGRAVRSRCSGLLLVVPGLERVEIVSVQPATLDPLHVTATTRDGVSVRLVLSVLWRIVNPARSVAGGQDPQSVTADAVDRLVRHLVADVDLAALLRNREQVLARIPDAAAPQLAPLGAELLDVDLLNAEVRFGPELLRLLG